MLALLICSTLTCKSKYYCLIQSILCPNQAHKCPLCTQKSKDSPCNKENVSLTNQSCSLKFLLMLVALVELNWAFKVAGNSFRMASL